MQKNEMGQLERIQSLQIGEGIQSLINRAAAILGNPVFLFDMEYNSIAFPDGTQTDDPISNDLIFLGRLSDETIDFCRDECFIDAVASCDGVTYLISDKLKYERIFGQVYDAAHMPIADVCAVASDGPFPDNAPDLIRAICEKISKEIRHDTFYRTYGMTYQSVILHALIDGDVPDKRTYAGHAANVYDGLGRYLYLLVTDVSALVSDREQLYTVRDAMRRLRPRFKYTTFRDSVVILASTNEARFHPERVLRRLCPYLEENRISTGVSRRFENLFELPRSYREATEALKTARLIEQGLRLTVYE